MSTLSSFMQENRAMTQTRDPLLKPQMSTLSSFMQAFGDDADTFLDIQTIRPRGIGPDEWIKQAYVQFVETKSEGSMVLAHPTSSYRQKLANETFIDFLSEI